MDNCQLIPSSYSGEHLIRCVPQICFSRKAVCFVQLLFDHRRVYAAGVLKGLNLLIVQLAVNFCWPILFFNLRAYAFSHIWLLLLLGLVVWMTLEFRKADRLAALSQIPYIVWLCFAAVLNDRVMRM